MNVSTPALLAYCLLLTLTGSCRKQAVDEPQPNLANCRIVKETQWSESGRYKDQPETITVEGKQVVIYPQLITDFSYDQRGRIIREEIETEPGKDVFWTTYTYMLGRIIRVDRVLKDSNDKTQGLTNLQTVILLDQHGLNAKRQFDAEGYPVDTLDGEGRVKLVRVAGNLVQAINYWSDMTLYTAFRYDTSRPNLPNRYPFQGKLDQNLRTQYVATSPDAAYYKQGELYRVNLYYEFDRYGRVKRMIMAYHNDYASRWPYMPFGNTYPVFDYEYECP